MRVDIWADITCPWCYIGLARFAAARREFGHGAELEILYRSFELDPGQPAGQTRPVLDMLAAKYGLSRAQAAEAEARVAGLAQAEGLEFSPDRPVGNTRATHRLLQYAQASGRGPAMMTALYAAYFAAGQSVFEAGGLVAAAATAGLTAADVQAALTDDRYDEQISADLAEARHLGLTGVPFYVVGGTRGVAGAQPAEVFLAALEAAWADSHPGPASSQPRGRPSAEG
jgi:predicted DsbA family dithiol-disulfide isomerase